MDGVREDTCSTVTVTLSLMNVAVCVCSSFISELMCSDLTALKLIGRLTGTGPEFPGQHGAAVVSTDASRCGCSRFKSTGQHHLCMFSSSETRDPELYKQQVEVLGGFVCGSSQ